MGYFLTFKRQHIKLLTLIINLSLETLDFLVEQEFVTNELRCAELAQFSYFFSAFHSVTTKNEIFFHVLHP